MFLFLSKIIYFFNFKGCPNVRWQQNAVNREEWAFAIKKAKALRGLLIPGVQVHLITNH